MFYCISKRADSVYKLQSLSFVVVVVLGCPLQIPTLPGGPDTSGQRMHRLYCLTRRRKIFGKLERFFGFWFCIWFFGSVLMNQSLLCIVGELAGGGSVAVAVCVGDMWQVTCDTWYLTPDTWHKLLFLFFFYQSFYPHTFPPPAISTIIQSEFFVLANH